LDTRCIITFFRHVSSSRFYLPFHSERQELLQPGDILVFASDGITEAGSDRRFGTDRLKEVVWDHRRLPAREIADAVIDAVMRYDVTVPDDLSIVVTRSLP